MAWFLARGLQTAIGVLVILFSTSASVTAATAVAETRVGAFEVARQVSVGVSDRIGAGQRLGEAAPQAGFVVATGVAANAGAKLSGRRVLGDGWDDAIRAARGEKPEPGRFDVIAHGTPNSVFDASGNALSPSELARVIRGTPSWAGQDVRLLSCSTGYPSGSFAQSLATELGVSVKAPTTNFYVNSRGGIVFDPGGS